MNNVIITILSLSVSGSILALALFAGKPLLKKCVSKTFSYYIWLIVFVRLVLPIGSPVLFMDALFSPAYHGTGPVISDGNTDEPGKVDTGNGNEFTVSPESQPGSYGTVISTPTSMEAPIMDSQKDAFNFGDWLYDNLFLIWLAGAVVCAGWFVLSYVIFIRRIIRSCTAAHPDDLVLFARLKGKKHILLACSNRITTPILVGIIRPVIILPQLAYVHNGMDKELENILLHELTHYRRKDTLYKWLIAAVTTVHWFNPLMYFVGREVGRACELSCDEAVIRHMSASEKQRYGNTLIALSAGKRLPAGIPSATLCAEKADLKGRLVSIMEYKKKPIWAITLMIVLALFLTGCAAALGSVNFPDGAQDIVGAGISAEGGQPAQTDAVPTDTDDTAVATTPLVSMLSYDGKIYYKTYEITEEEFQKQVETYDAALGTVGIFVGSDTLPDNSLETNDPSVVGKNILSYYRKLSPDDSVVLDENGKLILYQYLDMCSPKDKPVTGEFVSMFYYNGHIYTKAQYDIDYKIYEGYKGPLGTISAFVGSDVTPSGELETNDKTLVGADIAGYHSIEATGDTVAVAYNGEYVAYEARYINESIVKPLYISDKSVFKTETEFLQEIRKTLLVSYDEISVKEWAASYGGSLANPEYVPERYKHYDGVFVKSDPGIPEQTMIAQLWYDPSTYDVLTVTQEVSPGTTLNVDFGFFEKDEVGQPINKTYPWANYRSAYGMTCGDEWIYGYMLVNGADQKDECQRILQSLQAG
jgi:beta-lactamase regulating signal transducer with metallopeptidase domain